MVMSARLFAKSDAGRLDQALSQLAAAFGNRLVTSNAVRAQHANTTTWIAPQPPDAVVFPQSTADVQEVVSICAALRIPIIPFGTGTSFEGHVNAPFGGVSIDLADMNRVLAVHAEDFDCVVEPGITRKRLNENLRDQGLFFPVDPGADAALGGMVSTRASGTTAVRYGTMKDNVLAMKVVLPNGEVATTSRRARKSSAGYDLTRLMIGAEGTLGVITELTLKLHAIPEATSAGTCRFPTVKQCCDAAIAAIQAGIPMARIELLDEVQVHVCNVHSKLGLPEVPTMFAEFHGSPAAVTEHAALFGEIVQEYGGSPFESAIRLEDRNRLWQARHDVFWAQRSFRPGAAVMVTDVCVPISRLAECVNATKADIEESGLIAPIVGHVGDGNFHTSPLIMMDDPDEVSRAKAFAERLVERALAMEGTCTGEHGIGAGKRHFMVPEHGLGAINLMRAIKAAVDPDGIMNPGKMF
jgi:D-lactate dehydrogenase (cytochrome)